MALLLFFAFLSGIVTVLSPCILPVLPLLLSAGLGQGKYRPYGIISGLVVSFTFFTLSLTALVQATGVSPDVLRYLSLILIGFFGLTLIFPSLEHAFARITAPIANLGNKIESQNASGTGFTAGFVLGTALGLVWAPCAGPILATITTLVATGSVTAQAVFITLAYSLGTALPMFLIIRGGDTIIKSISKITPYAGSIRKAFGILMIASALAIAFHIDVALQQLTLRYFPSIHIENNTAVQKELNALQDANNDAPIPTLGSHAPDFKNIASWINSPALTMEELKGKVVLIDFWTYSCINCVRTLPYLKQWYERYKNSGFVIVGVHTPEFEFEKKKSNVENAAQRFDLTYPIALDSNYGTWKNYHNRYWPAHYLIDQNGIIRLIHFGEGSYTTTENKIRTLLGLTPLEQKEPLRTQQDLTHEIYLGSQRAANYTYESHVSAHTTKNYTMNRQPDLNHVGLQGSWLIEPEEITSQDIHAKLTLHFTATQVYLVMSAQQKASVSVELDNKPVASLYYTKDMDDNGNIIVEESRMYHILDLKNDGGVHMLTLTVPEGVSLFAFTFGGRSSE